MKGPQEMCKVIGLRRHVRNELASSPIVATEQHSSGSRNIDPDIVAKREVQDMTRYKPSDNKEAKGYVAGSLVAEVAEDFGYLPDGTKTLEVCARYKESSKLAVLTGNNKSTTSMRHRTTFAARVYRYT